MNKFLSISILLPHCDDELFILAFIEQKISEGYLINVFFLLEANLIRQKESQKIFSKYSAVNVSHLGFDHHVPDGKLSEHHERVLLLLDKNEKIQNSQFIVTAAFEGGHVDHDASFLIGNELSRRLNKDHFCFSTYNSYQTFFVRVSRIYLGKMDGEITEVRFNINDGIRYLFNCTKYGSQFVILAVLFPGLVRMFLFRRKIEMLRVIKFYPDRPHPGRLFYESNFKKKMKSLLLVQ
jgi:hypothetical protein